MLNYDYQELEEKLEDTCIDNNLEYSFETSKFPIVLRITPDFEQKNQMKMDIGDNNFVNGEIQFIFADELTIKILNDFRIGDKLLNKIKNQAKKLHYIYLQMYFKERMTD